MKKCLIVSTVSRQFTLFERGNIEVLKKLGYEIHCAANFTDATSDLDELEIIRHHIDIQRSPYSLTNIKAYKQLKEIIDNDNFDLIHCHSPMGGVLARLAARQTRKKGTKVFYTAHGFHFYKGAPIKNWLLFYPVEKYLSKYTDTIITINKEDYNLAKSKFIRTNVEYVLGIGIDEKKFNFEMTEEEKVDLRKSLNLKEDDFVIIYTAELSERKNQGMLIKAMDKLVGDNKNIHLLLPGRDSMNGKYQELVKKLNLDNNIHFLGYRRDIPRLLKISNLAVSSSKQEGLPVNIMEAMVCGLPIIVTNCRGNRDLIENDKNGYLVEIDDINDFIKVTVNLYSNNEMRYYFGKNSVRIIDKYLIQNISNEMILIYDNCVN